MFLKDELTSKILPRSNTQQVLDYKDEEEEAFTVTVGEPTYFCVGIVDIVNSTKTVARLPPNKSSRYYEVFLNNMAKVVRQYNGQILKTMGDSLLFYFPDTSFSQRKFGFLSCIECGFSLMGSHEKLKKILSDEQLPPIDFRISFDYGNVTMMRNSDWAVDLVGPTINTCAKINGICPVNEMVVGSDLYEKTKNFREYKFKNIGSFSADLRHPYPVFTLIRNE
jgi:class 3 adenylate cyclase